MASAVASPSPSSSPARPRVGPRLAAAVLVLAAGLAAASMHRLVEAARTQWPAEADVLYVPPPSTLAPMSLGYREAIADLIWIRALVFAGKHLGDADVRAVKRYADAITGLAPRFQRAYKWGAITVIYGGNAAVTREMVDTAADIYRRGLEQFPESHELLYPFGMLLMTQVGSTPGYSDEERRRLAREGADAIRRAAAFGADPLVRRYAATLVTDYASDQLAVQFLQTQLAAATEDAHRRLLRKKLGELTGVEEVAAVERIREEFFGELGEQRPYLTDTVYAIIRDEATPSAAGPLNRP